MAEESTRNAAKRALEEPDFAREVLDSQKYPQVREAILEEIATLAAKDSSFLERFIEHPKSSGDRLRRLADADIAAPKPW